uniref:Pyr_redox_2 domain-containing protein n=1 Tax=Macrostomum lignano TaxID=282301 RepID=A0A1I8FP86_9PLAT
LVHQQVAFNSCSDSEAKPRPFSGGSTNTTLSLGRGIARCHLRGRPWQRWSRTPGADCVRLACGQSRHQPAAVTKLLEEFDVEERPLAEFQRQQRQRSGLRSVSVLHASCTVSTRRLGSSAASLANPEPSAAGEAAEVRIGYGELCLCTGASPKLIPQARQHPDLVVGIRDTETVADLCRRVDASFVVGNGGIATELVYELRNVDVVWAVRQDSIGAVFFDAGAAQFLLPQSGAAWRAFQLAEDSAPPPLKQQRQQEQQQMRGRRAAPDRHHRSDRFLAGVRRAQQRRTAGRRFDRQRNRSDADRPAGRRRRRPALDAEGAVAVDAACAAPWRTLSRRDACGCAGWSSDGETSSAAEETRLWFQMRLWSQARQTGSFAARCMSAARRGESPPPLDIGFRAVHPRHPVFQLQDRAAGPVQRTRLGQRRIRGAASCDPGVEYVKCVMRNGRIQGCVLIGETDLEETF